MHLEPTGVERIGAEAALDLLARHLEEVGAARHPLAVELHAERLHHRLLEGGGIDESELEHPLQDLVAAIEGVLGAFDGVILVAGARDHPRQQRRLGKAQLDRRLLEVELGGRLHTVGAVTEEDLVGIQGEDLVLRVPLLDVESEQSLLDLAG